MTEHHVPLSRLLGDEPLLGSRLAAEYPAQEEPAMSQPTGPVTRAKFYVVETGKTVAGGRVKLNAVCRGKDNAQWAAATPSGSIEMWIANQAALAGFEPGDEFYVDFTPAPKGQEG